MDTKTVRGIDIAIAIAAACCYAVVYLYWERSLDQLFWDFDVYERAVADATLGYNPYRQDVLLPFYYHPVVMYALLLLDRFIGLKLAFGGLCAASVLLFLLGCNRLRVQAIRTQHLRAHEEILMLLAAFSFGSAGVLSVISGNVTLYLHLALIGSALIYQDGRKNGPWLLMLAVFFVSLLVKPYFLVYALPLVLVDRFSLRSMVGVAMSVGLATAVYGLFWVFDRAHSLQFFHALEAHLDRGADLGFSFFGLSTQFFSIDAAFRIHIAISAVLAGAMLFSRNSVARFVPANVSDGSILLLAYGVMTLCNPRMKEYDLIPALICFYLYFSAGGRFGKSLVLLSLMIAQLPMWATWYRGPDNFPTVVEMNFWQTGAVVAMLLVYVVGGYWRGGRASA